MATLTFNGKAYTVDHAVKGADYVHGYNASGNCVVSIDGVKDFSAIAYDGEYLAPDSCFAESCNEVRCVGGKLVKRDGTEVPDLGAPIIQVSTCRALKASDIGKFLRVDASVTITVSANVLPVGAELEIFRNTSGVVTIAADGVSFAVAGNTGLTTESHAISYQYASAVLKQIADNVWSVQGAI